MDHGQIVFRSVRGGWINSGQARAAAAMLVGCTAQAIWRAAFEQIWYGSLGDLEERRQTTKEFPMTAMTRALGEAIWTLNASSSTTPALPRALDLGTGSGVHALLMAAGGYQVIGTDIHEEAVQHATARYLRLAPRLQHYLPFTGGGLPFEARVSFRTRSVDDDWSGERFSLITFNPPAYYSAGVSIDISPAASGVFAAAMPATAQSTLLFRFFSNAVLPALAPGGRVICTWPALERSVVEPAVYDGSHAPILTPHQLLTSWLHVSITGACTNPALFFTKRAVISDDYGLGSTFRLALDAGIRARFYSPLVHGGGSAGAPSFRFGVLCLQRDWHDPSLFHNVQL